MRILPHSKQYTAILHRFVAFAGLKTQSSQSKSSNRIRRLASLLMLLVGTGSALAQTDYSGTYYIASDYQNPSNKVRQYDPNTLANNYYLCPSDGWIYYKPDNDWSADGTTYPNPFLTTYKCRTNGYSMYGGMDNAKWVITKHGDYYSFYHTGTGQYMMFSGQINGCGADRMRVHLETVDGNLPDNALFTISADGRSVIIHPQSVPEDHLTVNGGNKNSLAGESGKTGGPTGYANTAGIIGIWRGNEDNNFFYLEDCIARPTIGFNGSQEIEITAVQQGATIIYTTDGTTPTLSNGQTYTGPFDPQEGTTTFKAIAIVNNEASNVATFTTPVLCGTTHNYLIQSQNNAWNTTDFHFYMIPGNDDKVNTTSLFRPTMEWHFETAGTQDGVPYFYIVNNGNSKYLCYDATNNVHMEDFSSNDKFKFKIEEVTNGTFNIIPYSLRTATGNTNRFIYKPSNGNNICNANNSNINLSNTSNANSQWKFIPSDTNPLDKTAPFIASTGGSYSYYKIASVGSNGYYIVPGATNVTTSNSVSNDMNWYFEVAQESGSSDWLTYYHIRNAVTGQYLYLTKDANNDGACLEMRSTIDPANADRYMFTWARTATQDTYYIIPKLLKDASLNDFSSLQRDNGTLKTNLTRGAGNYAWTFTASSYTCSQPVITWDAVAGGYVISSTESDAKYYYYISHESLTPYTPTLYTGPINVSGLGTSTATIRAYATRNSDESDKSTDAILTVYRVEAPAFTTGVGTVKLSCATDGASIYYEMDATSPGTPNPSTSTLYNSPIEGVSGKIIKAIAVKDGWINSPVATSEKVMFTCATPVIRKTSATTFTIECSFPDNGVSIYYTTDGSVPTTSGTLYSGSVSFSAGDLPFTIKAVAVATDYNNSAVVTKAFSQDLSEDTDGFYNIATADDFNKFIEMANEYCANGNFKVTADIDVPFGTEPVSLAFTGLFTGVAKDDGSLPVISGLDHALFNTIKGGTVKNIILDNVTISGGTNVGAICNEATGATRIYNCGVLATGSNVETDEKGYTEITGYSSYLSGSGYVGGIVGLLDGSSRVINCFSYAEIKGGSHVGGIAGYNNVATNADSEDADHYLKTMVMNCMFYGDITGGSNKAPIYNGEIISNKDSIGLGNYNYFRAEASYVQNHDIDTYNCALMAETRFLQRFEFFRHVLNSNRELAAWYATGSTANKGQILKWVMEPGQIGSDIPYPTLKTPGRYHSVVYIDDLNVSTGKSQSIGTGLGTLTVTVSMGSGGEQFSAPAGAAITTSSLILDITDKDPDHFNYNYGKVQLPYYNDVGTNNYTGNRVVTGWKIVSITGGTAGTLTQSGSNVVFDGEGNISTMPYNFADRQCTNKDLYSASGRVFNQGDYWDVPDGVTAITIQPYWAKAAYVSDPYYDKVYNEIMTTGYDVTSVGGGQRYVNKNSYSINGDNQKVYTSIASALGDNAFKPNASHTVYDYAVVLVGNYHQYNGINNSLPYTVMSIDLDRDNEPDYSFMLRFDGRTLFHHARYDFLNLIGLGMAQKSTGGTGSYNLGILQPKYWFEVTNTALFRVTQFEYSPASRVLNPIILQGGVIEQWVTQQQDAGDKVNYFLVGDNVWFKEFHRGSHQDNAGKSTPHPPVSVTGGDFESFYLTGLYQSNAAIYSDDAECYISGGKFGTMAGAGMEGIGDASKNTGNIFWQIDHADIDEFYGGGINAVKPVQGNIYTVIRNSNVKQFCGGPKFGDMQNGRTVTTIADNCTFTTFFGAGYGGSSYNRYAPKNQTEVMNPTKPGWNTWISQEFKQEYSSDAAKNGISTRFDYQFIPQSNNINNVARLFVEYVSFSLATTRNVHSTLNGCTINGNFYGGGSLGKVDGDISSTLINCTVTGNVFGAGYSASTPTVEVMPTTGFITEPYYYQDLGSFGQGVLPSKDPYLAPGQQTDTYTWQHGNAISIDKTNHILYTTLDLSKSNLGSVSGAVNLTITGDSRIGTEGDSSTGNVYGGGDESAVNNSTTAADARTTVTLSGNAQVLGNVYGGGNRGMVSGSTETLLTDDNSTTGGVEVIGSVYGGGNAASVGTTGQSTQATVNISGENARVDGQVYGGCNSEGSVIGKSVVTITAGTVGTAAGQGEPANNVVFGGGKGQPTLIEGDVEVNIDGSATINGSVYGGSAFGNVNASLTGSPAALTPVTGARTDVNIIGGTINGDAYGGGLGQDLDGTENDIEANVYGDVTVTTSGGRVYDVFGCNNILGTPLKEVTVNIQGGSIVSSVYGGGNLAAYTPTDAQGYLMVNIIDGTVAENVFGGGFGQSATVTANPKVTLTGGTVQGSVFGGGDLAVVSGMVTVDVNGGTVIGDVYGGGALANTNTGYYNLDAGTIYIADGVYTTQVNLHGGTVTGNVYGGGLGQISGTDIADVKAYVGSTRIELNPGVQDTCVVQGNIFGCNNLNGTPTGGVLVHIYKTQGWAGHDVSDYKNVDDAPKDNSVYELAAVYGGGNLADYIPIGTDTATCVIIDGCGETSIRKVYGGGNAASTPATNVTVHGTFEIAELFGGGNGKDQINVNGTIKDNPGAHVGYKAYPDDAVDKTNYIYGTGRSNVTIYGGTIHAVYGGSDTKGNVRHQAVMLLDAAYNVGDPSYCPFDVDHTYGGGKNAPMDGQVIMKLECIPGLNTIYGGAENADVNGDVVLNITNGQYRQVFGGNNIGGQVNGAITINIEETGCQPIIIGELYGGGRKAPYSVYGYKFEGTGDDKVLKPRTSMQDDGTGPATPFDDPTINIKSFTSIGNVYGGGLGVEAEMVGNPHVNINVGYGAYNNDDIGVYAGDTMQVENIDGATADVILPAHKKGDIGSINTVYGGGNAANVIGDTYVYIGTEAQVHLESTGQYIPVQGAIIEDNVYGGGNQADVTGSTHIQVGP